MRRFFSKEISDVTVLSGQEAAHIAQVLRMQPGDRVILFDGSGMDYYCQIDSVGKKEVILHVYDRCPNAQEPSVSLTLYSAGIKKDKLDFALQKATELGISRFCYYTAARSVKQIKDADKQTEHLYRVALEAAKQCGRARIPEIEYIGDSDAVKASIAQHELVCFAYEEETHPLRAVLREHRGVKNIGVIIGPEGGFTPEEATAFVEAGASACSLGKLILRAETASIAAVSMILYETEQK